MSISEDVNENLRFPSSTSKVLRDEGRQEVTHACDDLQLTECREPPAFDVNRSYSNDGRLLDHKSPTRIGTQLQSVPTCAQPSGPQKNQNQRHPRLWRFRKEMVIGAGADGKVYLAVDLQTNERIAVKEILISPGARKTLQEAQEDSKKIAVMKRQIEALCRLPEHPNIVRHLGAERTTCALDVMMEYVPGGSISALLSKLGAFNENVVRIYARHICSALSFLHSNGVIHRDIKGANCLIGVEGVAKVCDFGCSIISTLESGVTAKGIHGTSMWMSPECIQSGVISTKTDIWSLGCTVIEMATGRPPWYEAHFTNEWAAMFHISQSKRGPPIPSHLSRQAHAFLARCFAINPLDRPNADECLALPFLQDEFSPGSENPEFNPPTPTEVNAPFVPNSTICQAPDDYETSNYSSFQGGVFDQEWGDAETAVGEDENEHSHINSEIHISHSPPPESKQQVSLEAIDTFLRESGIPIVTPPLVTPTASTRFQLEIDDVFGMGLSEPVLYNVFSFLDARALSALCCVSKALKEITDCGAKEILWKTLFLQCFGEVDVVKMSLRKCWKNYFKSSFIHQSFLVEDRFKVVRQHGQSDRVFDGVDLQTKDDVIIKVESWQLPQRTRASSSQGSQNVRAASPMREPTKAFTATRTPTKKGSSFNVVRPMPPPLPPSLSSPHKNPRDDFTSSEKASPSFVVGSTLGGSRPPLGRVNQTSPQKQQRPPATQPQPHLPFNGNNNLSIRRTLPRNNRLPSPSGVVSLQHRRAISPSYRDGAAPAPHFVFLQPSVLFQNTQHNAHNTQESPESRDKNELHVRSEAQAQHSRPPDSFNATMNNTLTREQFPPKGGWEIYEFQRTSELAPLITPKVAPKSLLQQDFRFLRHLEALGARSIPRVLTYHDSDEHLQRNVLVTSRLGPSLNELLLFCGNQLTLRTLSLLTLRLLDALEEIHERDVVHGNISPTNIVMGAGLADDHVYLINFAHARFFRDPRTHRPTNTSTSSVTAERAKKHNEFLSFCSTFVQRRCTAAPRDDIIALGYVLCYLFHGGLPWTRDKTINVGDLLTQKTAYLESLQRTPPIQLHYFLKSGYALRQGEIPDYRYLKSLVSRLMEEKKWNDDGVFDWSVQLQQ